MTSLMRSANTPIQLETLMVKRVQPFRSSGSPGESPFSTNSTNTVEIHTKFDFTLLNMILDKKFEVYRQ